MSNAAIYTRKMAIKDRNEVHAALLWLVSGIPDNLWKFYPDAAPAEITPHLVFARECYEKNRSAKP